MEDIEFTEDQHKLWNALIERQLPQVEEWACADFLEGLSRIDFPHDRVPNLDHLNSKITPQSGWKIIRTKVRYTDSLPWYQHFAKREFIVTDYLRSWEEFEFTHEPDMFHDLFGHLPFYTLPEYGRLVDLFPPVFLRANKEQQENIKRLAWFSYEFGIIRERGENKIFGAGILSSIGEISHVAQGKTPILPFTIENVLKREKSIYDFNDELFVFDSVEELVTELTSYFDTIDGPAVDVKKIGEINELSMV
jgi:phenylalanine-4-hydroxylase